MASRDRRPTNSGLPPPQIRLSKTYTSGFPSYGSRKPGYPQEDPLPPLLLVPEEVLDRKRQADPRGLSAAAPARKKSTGNLSLFIPGLTPRDSLSAHALAAEASVPAAPSFAGPNAPEATQDGSTQQRLLPKKRASKIPESISLQNFKRATRSSVFRSNKKPEAFPFESFGRGTKTGVDKMDRRTRKTRQSDAIQTLPPLTSRPKYGEAKPVIRKFTPNTLRRRLEQPLPLVPPPVPYVSKREERLKRQSEEHIREQQKQRLKRLSQETLLQQRQPRIRRQSQSQDSLLQLQGQSRLRRPSQDSMIQQQRQSRLGRSSQDSLLQQQRQSRLRRSSQDSLIQQQRQSRLGRLSQDSLIRQQRQSRLGRSSQDSLLQQRRESGIRRQSQDPLPRRQHQSRLARQPQEDLVQQQKRQSMLIRQSTEEILHQQRHRAMLRRKSQEALLRQQKDHAALQRRQAQDELIKEQRRQTLLRRQSQESITEKPLQSRLRRTSQERVLPQRGLSRIRRTSQDSISMQQRRPTLAPQPHQNIVQPAPKQQSYAPVRRQSQESLLQNSTYYLRQSQENLNANSDIPEKRPAGAQRRHTTLEEDLNAWKEKYHTIANLPSMTQKQEPMVDTRRKAVAATLNSLKVFKTQSTGIDLERVSTLKGRRELDTSSNRTLASLFDRPDEYSRKIGLPQRDTKQYREEEFDVALPTHEPSKLSNQHEDMDATKLWNYREMHRVSKSTQSFWVGRYISLRDRMLNTYPYEREDTRNRLLWEIFAKEVVEALGDDKWDEFVRFKNNMRKHCWEIQDREREDSE
ncbi:hypothetical protein BJ508DRAFT_358995 [Ascobolus immersus RN42]|uniref:Uncharacterized protein n=1 Tax=Ascobolus immersus RN42 TaxID=1160509 RepID=A0A3N4IGI1_ASCIM|nr:hypothetical protein BJ508DRAFT_358995 [Ascobolus immersus RN42]